MKNKASKQVSAISEQKTEKIREKNIIEHLSLIVAFVSGVAAVVVALISFWTLNEIKKQRETTYHPEIIVGSKFFNLYNDPPTDKGFPNVYSSVGKDTMVDSYLNPFLSLRLYNIGFASAKNIHVDFEFDLNSVIKLIKQQNDQLPQDKIINVNIHSSYLSLEGAVNAPISHKGINLGFEANHKFDHLLPVNVSNEPKLIVVPTWITECFSVYVYNFWLADKGGYFPDFPPTKIKLQYQDIGNKWFVKEYNLKFKYNGGSRMESWGEIEVSEMSPSTIDELN